MDVEVGDFVKLVGGNDEWEVNDVTHEHYQVHLGNVDISIKKELATLSRKTLSFDDKYDNMKEALTLIWLNDWSAVSGQKRASDFAGEILKAVGEFPTE